MIINKKFTVGTRGYVELSKDNPPLSFMTPFNENEAYNKRLQTLKNWCNGYYNIDKNSEELHIFDNELMNGFKIDTVVSRWSTSNKLFRLQDPRGFTVEISSDNLCDIILNSTIKNGAILDKCIWSGKYLLVETSDNYKNALIEGENNKRISVKDLVFGGLYSAGHDGKQYLYLGKYEKKFIFSYYDDGNYLKEKKCHLSVPEFKNNYSFKYSHGILDNYKDIFKQSIEEKIEIISEYRQKAKKSEERQEKHTSEIYLRLAESTTNTVNNYIDSLNKIGLSEIVKGIKIKE